MTQMITGSTARRRKIRQSDRVKAEKFMRRNIITFFIVCFLIISFCANTVLAQIDRPIRNVKIDVAIKKAGYNDRIFSTNTFKQRTNQTIVVLDGYDATLFVGERIPYARWFCRYLHDNEYTARCSLIFLRLAAGLR